jgi:hypothetical protein
MALAIGLPACGDDHAVIDAPRPIDMAQMIDAPGHPDVTYQSDEGGEVRLEYMNFPNGVPANTRARATSFFFDGPRGNGFNPFPNIPGCTEWGNPSMYYPFAPRDPAVKHLDVGQVIITGGPQQMTVPVITPVQGTCSTTTATRCWLNPDCPATETCVGATGHRDNIGRLYKEKWGFGGQPPGPSYNNMGPAFITADATYDIILTGSPTWPAQIFKDAMYMPGDWQLVSPALNVNPVLQADQDLVITYTTPTAVNKPAGYPVNMLVHFGYGSPFIGVASCIEEETDGSITIPAAIVNKIRAAAPTGGTFIRQHSSHIVKELTDGVTRTNKRIDIIGIWCYNYTFTVAP